ncbi:DUF6438 domain-containing protein [Flavobacterium silvaticum]|uniref:DUF6438 domain-containing protein n=1 Tax=Flavobacterium silvaticum TaxID=1852020 RepID=A0A972FLM6_9FLAO|nr:DUF6438 domain-containing protein [Flavobacterium silvaticum]NMH27917.1 hypothetical protein [Flavobacterium silvaticum]
MMQKIFLIKKILPLYFVLLLAGCHKSPKAELLATTKIDSIASVAQLREFVTSIDSTYDLYSYDSISDFRLKYESAGYCPVLADSAHMDKNFLKADFDNNGYNDLLVVARYKDYSLSLFTVFGYKDAYRVKSMTDGSMDDCRYPQLVAIDGLPALNLFFYERNSLTDRGIQKKKLVYKYGGFIEYNPNPKKHRIQKILIQVWPCFGKCPFFKMELNADKSACLEAINYNYKVIKFPEFSGEIRGVFTTNIKDKDFGGFIDLVNYLDFENLREEYTVMYSDAASVDIEITYDDGKVKKIHDYGTVGTYGLIRLYQITEELRFNQDWKPVQAEAQKP